MVLQKSVNNLQSMVSALKRDHETKDLECLVLRFACMSATKDRIFICSHNSTEMSNYIPLQIIVICLLTSSTTSQQKFSSTQEIFSKKTN